MKPSSPLDSAPGLPRREFLKVGAGFSLALVLAGTLGCSRGDRAAGYEFLLPADVELFTALAPAVVAELANADAGPRRQRVDAMLRTLDAIGAGLDQGSRRELRKLLDLLAIAPLRYLLTGVGAWREAGIERMRAFLERWRGSRFATLTAGGNVLVQLTASSCYRQPESWPWAGYPGPLEYAYKAINT